MDCCCTIAIVLCSHNDKESSYHLNIMREVIRGKGTFNVLGNGNLFGLLVRGLEGARKIKTKSSGEMACQRIDRSGHTCRYFCLILKRHLMTI